MIQNVNDSSSQGYELAQSEFGKLSERPQSSKDWVDFFINSTKENSDVYFCSGVAAFITEKEAASLDMRTFNKELGQLANVAGQYLHGGIGTYIGSLFRSSEPVTMIPDGFLYPVVNN